MTHVQAPTPVDEDSFVDWVRPSVLAMTRLVRRLAPDADVQDLVQDAVEIAWRRRASYDPARATPTAWLLAITASTARDSRRTWLRRRLLTQQVPAVPEAVDDRPADVDLDRAVRSLPHRQRLAITCFYFLDLTVADTARVMRCSEGTVKSTLSDARSSLRTDLGDTHA